MRSSGMELAGVDIRKEREDEEQGTFPKYLKL